VEKRAIFFCERSFSFKYVRIAGVSLLFQSGVPITIKS
jgi:hypothetical protein